MGVIKRQGFKSAIVSYIGVVIGAIAMLRVYPLDMEIYGYAQWLISTVTLMFPLATFGILTLLIKYFPSYQKADSKSYNGLLTLLLSGLVVTYSVFLIFWFFFKQHFITLLNWAKIPNADIIMKNEAYLLILLGFFILLRFCVNHSLNGLRIVVPNIVEKLGFKIYLPLLVLTFVYFKFSTQIFVYGLLAFFLMAAVLLFIYLKYLGILKFGKIRRPKNSDSYTEMTKYSLFSSLNHLGTTLSVRMDSIMIPLFLSMASNGFYNIALFVSNVLDFPARSLTQIAAPIIANAWEEDDLGEIDMIYKKAATNLLLISGLTFLLIWFVLDDLAYLSTDAESFMKVRSIFLILGVAKLIDMLTSVNSHILIYSSSYKLNLVFLLVLGVINVYLNFLWIPLHGVAGAAMATAFSMLIYNVLKTGFIYFKYGLQPFSFAQIKILVLMGLFIGLYMVLPDTNSPVFNLLFKSALVGGSYLYLAYLWKVSEDANEMGLNILRRLRLIK